MDDKRDGFEGPENPDDVEQAGEAGRLVSPDTHSDTADDRDRAGDDALGDMPSYNALRRYVSGISDEREMRSIAAWAAASPRRREYLATLRRTARATARELSEGTSARSDAAWASLSAKIGFSAATANPVLPSAAGMPVSSIEKHRRVRLPRTDVAARQRRQRRRWLAAAAAAAIVAVVGVRELQRDPAVEAAAPQPVRTVATQAGQRAEVTLSDGTTVILGMKSQLRFPADFGIGSREIELRGQAYFVVAHDAAHVFVVRTAGSRIVDIGTAFVVRAYPESEEERVVVTEGAVTLAADSGSARPIMLVKGQMGELPRGATVPTVRAVDPTVYTAWLNDRLAFDNAPMSEVVAELARWYDVNVTLGDSALADETFTASFTTESLNETLKALTTVLDLRAERVDGSIVLHKRVR